MIIGITGGSGCGKTTALSAISQLGGLVIDCDAVYHDLLRTDCKLLSAIEMRFPGTVAQGVLDRKTLASIVFSDENALRDLNAITHTAVKQKVLEMLATCPTFAAIDAIGLFESGLNVLCDITVAVTAPEDVRIDRLTARDAITEAQAQARIYAQRKQSDFITLCDYHLENNGTQAAFHEKCLAFFRSISIM